MRILLITWLITLVLPLYNGKVYRTQSYKPTNKEYLKLKERIKNGNNKNRN